MDDNALAPVIAVMLILAIGVTLFSVYTSVYLPGLKQQAEVEHLREVESGFVKFSSDIDNAMARASPNITYSEQIPLGGGDILLNSMKSSGTIRIQNEQIGNFHIQGVSNGSPADITIPLSLVNYSYIPNGNFWIDQGYTWQKGYVNITKGSRKTPLQYDSVVDSGFNETIEDLTQSLVIAKAKDNSPENFMVRIITMTAGQNNVTSSNGIAKLILKTKDETAKYLGAGSITLNNASVNFTGVPGNENFLGSGFDTMLPTSNNITIQVIGITVEAN